MTRLAAGFALALAALHLTTSWARAGSGIVDPCVRCDALYAVDCGGSLWVIDTSTLVSTLVGATGQSFYDLAVTSDGRLVGLDSAGVPWVISACDGSTTVLAGYVIGNGMAGDFTTTDLFVQGPPLVRLDSQGSGSQTSVGGTLGPAPPSWCGSSTGDLALSPTDLLLRSTVACGCAGDELLVVDPATGNVVRDAGCTQDASGTGWASLYGLAYTGDGRLWATSGLTAPQLLLVDPDTALVTVVPISGGYSCGFGLASLPCTAPGQPCAQPGPTPADIGDVLFAHGHGDPYAADITALFEWSGDRGAPRPPGQHYDVLRGTSPRALDYAAGSDGWTSTTWNDSTPAGTIFPYVHFYLIRADDGCNQVSAN